MNTNAVWKRNLFTLSTELKMTVGLYSVTVTVCPVCEVDQAETPHQHHKLCLLWPNIGGSIVHSSSVSSVSSCSFTSSSFCPASSSFRFFPSSSFSSFSSCSSSSYSNTSSSSFSSNFVLHCCVHTWLSIMKLWFLWLDWLHVSSHVHSEFRWQLTECGVSVSVP